MSVVVLVSLTKRAILKHCSCFGHADSAILTRKSLYTIPLFPPNPQKASSSGRYVPHNLTNRRNENSMQIPKPKKWTPVFPNFPYRFGGLGFRGLGFAGLLSGA